MRYSIKYGDSGLEFNVPDKNMLGVLLPKEDNTFFDEKRLIEDAINSPISFTSFNSFFSSGDKVTIITSDNTRPMPSYKVLPVIINKLNSLGISDSDITIVIAVGIHRPLNELEISQLVGKDIFKRIRCVNSSPTRCIQLGTTSNGTPINIDSYVVNADKRLCLGNVEYHYFAGFSGGIKAIFPGCSNRESIQANHKYMTDSSSYAGNVKDNIVRLDLEEMINYVGPTALLNVVLNVSKQIVYASFGDLIDAHRDACKHLESIYALPIQEQADIVITCQGGTPKDLNLYQTQKALDNSKFAVKDGGTIILVGACNEGFGESVFQQWMMSYNDPDAMINALHKDFKLGAHKAVAIALVRKKCNIVLVSDIDPALIKKTILEPYSSIQGALNRYLKDDSKVYIIPNGGSTLPIFNM